MLHIHAAFAGIGSLVSMCVLPVSAIGGWRKQPFRDLSQYVLESMFAVPHALLFLAIIWSFVFLVIFLVIFGVFIPWMRSQQPKITMRIVFLSPITMLLPGIIWSVFAWLSMLADPSTNFTGPGVKPAWLTSMPIQLFGSCFWMIAGPLWITVVCGLAHGQIGRFLNRLECRQCGYNLTGNLSGRCPECGEGT